MNTTLEMMTFDETLCACGGEKGKGDCAECEADRDFEQMSPEAFDAKWDGRNPKQEAYEQAEAALQARVLAQKVNANVDSGPAMKVLMRTQEDGRVEVVMPMGVPPDTRGYNLNRAFQKERVSKVVARLQKKQAAKQKTLVDHARELVEKALTPSK